MDRVKVRTRGDLVSWFLLLSMFAQALVPAVATPSRTACGAFSTGAGESTLAPALAATKKRTQLRAATDDGSLSGYFGFDGPIGLAAAAPPLSPISHLVRCDGLRLRSLFLAPD